MTNEINFDYLTDEEYFSKLNLFQKEFELYYHELHEDIHHEKSIGINKIFYRNQIEI